MNRFKSNIIKRTIHTTENTNNKEIPKQKLFERLKNTTDKAFTFMITSGKAVIIITSLFIGYRILTSSSNGLNEYNKRKPKYILEVIPLDDKLALYEESFLRARGQEEAIKAMKQKKYIQSKYAMTLVSLFIS